MPDGAVRRPRPMLYGFFKRVNQLWTRSDSAVVEADAKRQIEVHAEQHPLFASNQSMRDGTGALCRQEVPDRPTGPGLALVTPGGRAVGKRRLAPFSFAAFLTAFCLMNRS